MLVKPEASSGTRAALIACNERNDAASPSSRTCQLLICCCLFVHDSNVFTSLGDVKVPQIWSWRRRISCAEARGKQEAGAGLGTRGCRARDALQTAQPAPKSRAHGSNRKGHSNTLDTTARSVM